ncbi:hypothetical protein CF510_15554 [Pseudomonas aeruginosa PADK2_CF510]|nr:hypothetical protein CF510_15554 [Pseudomonas aeruginosa PADK2_CF510]
MLDLDHVPGLAQQLRGGALQLRRQAVDAGQQRVGANSAASSVERLRSGRRGSTTRRSRKGSRAWRSSALTGCLLCSSTVIRWPRAARLRSRWYWRVLPPLVVGQGE